MQLCPFLFISTAAMPVLSNAFLLACLIVFDTRQLHCPIWKILCKLGGLLICRYDQYLFYGRDREKELSYVTH